MGKAQSKRSVDITTDPAKDGVVTEGTGKLEKIEDVDQLKSQANGDAQHNEGDSVSSSVVVAPWDIECRVYFWYAREFEIKIKRQVTST